MFGRWIVPAVVGAVTTTKAKVGPLACWADKLAGLFCWLKLGYVVKDVKCHVGSGGAAVVAKKSPVATLLTSFCPLSEHL